LEISLDITQRDGRAKKCQVASLTKWVIISRGTRHISRASEVTVRDSYQCGSTPIRTARSDSQGKDRIWDISATEERERLAVTWRGRAVFGKRLWSPSRSLGPKIMTPMRRAISTISTMATTRSWTTLSRRCLGTIRGRTYSTFGNSLIVQGAPIRG